MLSIQLDGQYKYNDQSTIDALRVEEMARFELVTNGFTTDITYNQREMSVQNALYSIYTTSFIIVLLVVS